METPGIYRFLDVGLRYGFRVGMVLCSLECAPFTRVHVKFLFRSSRQTQQCFVFASLLFSPRGLASWSCEVLVFATVRA